MSPADVMANRDPGADIRVFLHDDSEFRFRNPYDTGDSLAARTGDYTIVVDKSDPDKGKPQLYVTNGEYIAVAYVDVKRIETSSFDVGKTVGLGLGLVAVGLSIAFAVVVAVGVSRYQ